MTEEIKGVLLSSNPLSEAVMRLAGVRGTQNAEGKLEPLPETPSSSLFALHTFAAIDDMAFFWLIMIFLIKQGKTDDVVDILKTFMSKPFEALSWYTRAGAANRITAWGSGYLNAMVLERFGFITRGQADAFALGNNLISGAELAEDFWAHMPFKINIGTHMAGDFPQQLTFADSVEAGETVRLKRGVIAQKGASKSITLEKKP